MALNFQQQIAADAQAGGVFYPGSQQGFDKLLTHYPAGDLSAGESVVGIVDRDQEDAGGVGSGEGAQFDRQDGVALRRSAILEIPISVEVTESSGQAGSPSLFEFDGTRWRTVRILGRDLAMQSVLVTRLDKLARRRTTR